MHTDFLQVHPRRRLPGSGLSSPRFHTGDLTRCGQRREGAGDDTLTTGADDPDRPFTI